MPQFRYLRESLTSHHSADAAFNVNAYELAAEVCLRAMDYAEFLKTMQTLVQSLYQSAVVSWHPFLFFFASDSPDFTGEL